MSRKEQRNLWLTLVGKGVSQIGTNIYAFAISFYILAQTGSSQSFAMSLVLSSLPRILVSPFAGNLVDRINKKWIVVASDVLSGLLMVGMYIGTMYQPLELGIIYFATVILSILLTFLNTAYSSSYVSIVSEDNIVKINSYQQVVTSVLEIISPILGGMIYAVIDIRLFLLFNGISFILSAITECFIDFKLYSLLKNVEKVKKHFFVDFKEGWSYIKTQKTLVVIIIYALVINFFAAAFSVVVPFDLVTTLKIPSAYIGIIEAFFPVGAIIISIYMGRKKIKFSKKLFRNMMGAFAGAMFLFVLPVMPIMWLENLTIPYYALAMAIIAGIIIGVNVPLSVLMQISIEESYRGRVFGIFGAISEGIVPLSYLMTGMLIEIIPTYIILGVVGVSILGIAFSIHRNTELTKYDEKIQCTENEGAICSN